jgi:hypothetical protein
LIGLNHLFSRFLNGAGGESHSVYLGSVRGLGSKNWRIVAQRN